MNDLKHIEELIEKFLGGRTTNVEEQQLYEWFASADVPEEWAELKEMFAWYAAGMPEGVVDMSSAPQKPARRSITLSRLFVATASVAAIVVAVVMPWPKSGESINIYEGSYIVENGVRYDNVEHIESDIKMVLCRADELEAKADELLAWADI